LKKKKEKKALESGVSPEQALHFFTSLHDTPNPNAAALPWTDSQAVEAIQFALNTNLALRIVNRQVCSARR
jgi:hypothetical protein